MECHTRNPIITWKPYYTAWRSKNVSETGKETHITEKMCRRCKIWKPLEELKADTRYTSGFSSFCKECHKAATIAWQKANPERFREYQKKLRERNRERLRQQQKARYDTTKARWQNIKRLYRMSRDEYEALLARQEERCAICRRHQSEFIRHLAVDHDHKCCSKTPTCGKCTRGLLCGACNTSLHRAEATEGWIQAASEYLRKGVS